MSNQVIIITMLAVLLLATFGTMWVMKVANEQRERIVMGVHQGVPLSLKHRWAIFSNDWMGFKYFSVGLLLVGGFAFLRAGQSAGDPDVRLVSFLSAGLLATGSLFIAVLGISDLFFILSVLRQTKQKK